MRTVRIAIVVVALAAAIPAIAVADQNAAVNLSTVTVAGLRLGMSAEEALPIIKARFGRVEILHTVCARDNAAALAAHQASAPAKCILAINAGAAIDLKDGPNLTTVFVENFPTKPGTVRLERVRYETPTRTSADANAFTAELLAKYGKPSAQSPNIVDGMRTTYCNGMEIIKPDLLHPSGNECEVDITDMDAGSSNNTIVSSTTMPFPSACSSLPVTPTIIMRTDVHDGGTSQILLTNHEAFCSEAVAMAKFFGSVNTQKSSF